MFHLGAQTIVGVAHRAPRQTFETNIQGTWNVLEACRLHAGLVERVVVASSDKAYGDPTRSCRTPRTCRSRGDHPYDVSKTCTDLIATTYARDLRPAGDHRPLRQHLRRRRPQLEPHRAGDDPVAAARRAADHPQRRHVRARLPPRRRRRATATWCSARAPTIAELAGRGASTSATSRRSRVMEMYEAMLCGRRSRRHRAARARRRGRRDPRPVPRRVQGAQGAGLGGVGRRSTTDWRGHTSGTPACSAARG